MAVENLSTQQNRIKVGHLALLRQMRDRALRNAELASKADAYDNAKEFQAEAEAIDAVLSYAGLQ